MSVRVDEEFTAPRHLRDTPAGREVPWGNVAAERGGGAARGYEAFGRGDVEAMLDILDPEVELRPEVAAPDLPFSNLYAPPGTRGLLSGSLGFARNGKRMGVRFLPTGNQQGDEGVLLAAFMRCETLDRSLRTPSVSR